MAWQPPFLSSPSGVCVQIQSYRYITFCQCRHQLLGASLSSSRDWRTKRGEIAFSDNVSSRSSRSPKFLWISASNSSVGRSTSSQNEIGSNNECRPALKPMKSYTVREAKLDEELWAAAWIRAESYCEEQPYVRYIESYKKRFAEQEFDALKRRLLGKYGLSIRCICLVAVSGRSSHDSGTQNATILERVVGTLDLSIRQLSHCETFPGDSIRATLSAGALDFQGSHQYGYIANVCVTKAARQNGIGSSLLGTAIKAGKNWGLKELFVHVNSTNKAAQCLYNKFKFQEEKCSHLSQTVSASKPFDVEIPRMICFPNSRFAYLLKSVSSLYPTASLGIYLMRWSGCVLF